MQKPNNYDSTNISNFTPVIPGGHKCKIMQVEETKSSTGKDMLKISIDMTADDTQPAYYTNQFITDKKADASKAKWRGVQYLLVDQGTDFGTANLKRFVTAVEESNAGFQVQWGNTFANCFKNAKVGIIFREEEYKKDDGNVGKSVKPYGFCKYDEAFDQKVPSPKTLAPAASTPAFVPSSDPVLANEGFMQIPDELTDEGLPFN